MKLKIALMFVTIMLIVLSLALPRVAAADDGAGLYKAKCAMCHGADGAGKPAAQIPSLLADDAKKASDATLTDDIANGGAEKKAAHAFQSKGLTPDQIKMIVSYIRDMQKNRLDSAAVIEAVLGLFQERLHAENAAAGLFEFRGFDHDGRQPFLR